jgi:hypothetical protein
MRRARAATGVGFVLALLLAPEAARAQDDAASALHVVWSAEGGASELWARRVERRLVDEGLEVRTEPEAWAREAGAHDTDARAVIVRVEAALAAARAAMRELDEAGALRTLARARTDVETALALPGTTAWVAELELAIGRVAAQAGEVGLARDAFARGFVLAPGRALGAAEAPPEVVALADEEMRRVRARPVGRFDVLVDWEGARVFLDEEDLGVAPRRVEARVGTHVLRVVAPGAASYARTIDVLAGSRAPMAIALSPTHLVAAARRAHALATTDALDTLPRAVAAMRAAWGRPVIVWRVQAGTGPFERAIAIACDDVTCHAPARLSTGSRQAPLAALAEGPLVPASERAAIAWMDEALPIEAPPPPSDPWTDGWPWAIVGGVGGALVLGAVITGVVLGTSPQHQRVFEVTTPCVSPACTP